jgi:hypothetical protein
MWSHVLRPGGLASLPYLAAVNVAYYGRTFRWKIRGWDPATRRESVDAVPAAAPVPAHI